MKKPAHLEPASNYDLKLLPGLAYLKDKGSPILILVFNYFEISKTPALSPASIIIIL